MLTRTRFFRALSLPVFLCAVTLFSSHSFAAQFEIKDRYAPTVISDSWPRVLSPPSPKLENFKLSLNLAPPLQLLSSTWVPGSLEWVRVNGIHIFPRARAKIKIASHSPVWLESGERRVLLQSGTEADTYEGEVTVALLDEAPLLHAYSEGKLSGTGSVQFVAAPSRSNFYLDSSCSNVAFTQISGKLKSSWAQIGCRWIVEPGELTSSAPVLEMYLYWHRMNDAPVMVNGQPYFQDPSKPAWLVLQLRPTRGESPQSFQLQSASDQIQFNVMVPKKYSAFHLTAGIGPYSYRMEKSTGSAAGLRPFATLYASYSFSETLRLASFTAFPITDQSFLDWGLYFVTEQIRAFDERISVNLLLGAHLLRFSDQNKTYSSISAPQGVELVIRDLFERGKNTALGGFFYPEISNRSYTNLWLRYTRAPLFYEINYISWKEPTLNTVTARSYGVSIGFPLLSL